MGLFGFFATLFSGGVYMAEDLKFTSDTANRREIARREGKVTYSDGRGRDYFTATGEQVHIQGGKVYSLKNTGQVLYDMNREYYMEWNQKTLEEAKAKGKKYMFSYYHPNPDTDRGYSSYPTEVATLKRFEVKPIVYKNKDKGCAWDFAFYKYYYDGKQRGEGIKITKKEFEELGGSVMGMTPEEYSDYEWKEREKWFKEINKPSRRR